MMASELKWYIKKTIKLLIEILKYFVSAYSASKPLNYAGKTVASHKKLRHRKTWLLVNNNNNNMYYYGNLYFNRRTYRVVVSRKCHF